MENKDQTYHEPLKSNSQFQSSSLKQLHLAPPNEGVNTVFKR